MPVLAASLPFLGEIVALFALSALIAYLCVRIQLVPIAGFLLTGVLVGPHALGLVRDPALVDTLAEIGVILLLFEIGIQFSLKKLARLKRALLLGGSLQVGGTIAAVAVIGWIAGVDLGTGLYTGGLIASSSTAIVMGILSSQGDADTPRGQLSLAILIFQNLAVVGLVLLVPMLAGGSGSALDIVAALGLAALVIGGVLLGARVLVPPILDAVARTRRLGLFVLVVAVVGLGTAWVAELAGVGVELGAFLGGLIVSESDYSEQALSDVLPVRSLFNALFFLSVGMLLDLTFLLEQPLVLLAALGGILVVKGIVVVGTVLVLGYPVRLAVAIGLALAQVGEFSFVLERTGREVGLSPFGLGEAGQQAFIVAAVVLMAATPGLVQLGPPLGRRLQHAMGDLLPDRSTDGLPEPEAPVEDHVVIVGYGPVGRRLAQVLHECRVPFFVMDLNPTSVEDARQDGYEAVYGDATRASVLRKAGIRRAKLCVVAINDHDAAQAVTRTVRHENPTAQLVVRARFLTDLEPLQEAGADIVVPEELEAAVQIYGHVLRAYMVPQEDIEEKVEAIRARDYKVLRTGQGTESLLLQGLDEEDIRTRMVQLRSECPAEGCTLKDLQLREKYGLSVLAVRRGDDTIAAPGGDVALHCGDRLVVAGSAEAFAESAPLFRAPDPVTKETAEA